MSEAPPFAVAAVDLYERPVRFRLPFRFGAATLREAPQAFVRATIRDTAGRETQGWTAEMMMPKWFDKRSDRSNDQNVSDLRAALALAREAYTSDISSRSAFGHAAHHYRDLVATGAMRDLNALVMAFGMSLVDRAILDAVCRAAGVSFQNAIRTNLVGLDAALAPDLDDFDFTAFLASRAPAREIAARHTVGLADPLTAREVFAPPDDGLPVSLEDTIARYGHRHFKVKLSGVVDDDVARLTAVARVLDQLNGYVVTLDANEQFQSVDDARSLWRTLRRQRPLARFVAQTLYMEQPLSRQTTAFADVHPLAHEVPLLIDEADDAYDAFPDARRRGYTGVSSKNCKGPYKSLVNAARCNGAPSRRLFLSAEDLTTQCGLAVQQDLALVSLLGVTHVERNGHHYVDGFAGQNAGAEEQAAFVAKHPDLYDTGPRGARLAIRNGTIALGSLDVVGFASAALPDRRSLKPMRPPRIRTHARNSP